MAAFKLDEVGLLPSVVALFLPVNTYGGTCSARDMVLLGVALKVDTQARMVALMVVTRGDVQGRGHSNIISCRPPCGFCRGYSMIRRVPTAISKQPKCSTLENL